MARFRKSRKIYKKKQNKTKQNRKKYLRNKKLLGGGDHIQKEKDLNNKYTHYQVNVKQYEVDDNNKIINYNEKWIKTYPNDDNSIRELKEHFLNDPKFIVRGLNREKM